MITREADYAIRAVLALARRRREGQGSASTAELSAEMEIPYRFLRKLVKRLVQARLVASRRGKGGGLILVCEPARVTLLDVIRAIGPAGARLSVCVVNPGLCGRSGFCSVHRVLRSAQQGLDRDLGAVTFADLLREAATRV